MARVNIEPEIGFLVPDRLRSDTEESVVGTLWHRKAIAALAAMLDEVSDRRAATWEVCDQLALVGLRHEDGTDYDPRPDIMVLPRPLRGNPSSVRLRDVGAPLFVVEMASESTKANDQGDKKQAYAAIGSPEYLVFDPDGNLLSAPILAWRLQSGSYVRWLPEADGWWRSAALDVSFRPLDDLPILSVRDRDGTVIEPTNRVRRRLREAEARLRVEEQSRIEEGCRRADLERSLAEESRRRAELEEQLRALRGEDA